MHQSAYFRFFAFSSITIRTVHVENVLSIAKCCFRCKVHSLNWIERLTGVKEICLSYEYRKGVRQIIEIFICLEILDIHNTGQIPCPMRLCSLVAPLNLDIIPSSIGLSPRRR